MPEKKKLKKVAGFVFGGALDLFFSREVRPGPRHPNPGLNQIQGHPDFEGSYLALEPSSKALCYY